MLAVLISVVVTSTPSSGSSGGGGTAVTFIANHKFVPRAAKFARQLRGHGGFGGPIVAIVSGDVTPADRAELQSLNVTLVHSGFERSGTAMRLKLPPHWNKIDIFTMPLFRRFDKVLYFDVDQCITGPVNFTALQLPPGAPLGLTSERHIARLRDFNPFIFWRNHTALRELMDTGGYAQMPKLPFLQALEHRTKYMFAGEDAHAWKISNGSHEHGAVGIQRFRAFQQMFPGMEKPPAFSTRVISFAPAAAEPPQALAAKTRRMLAMFKPAISVFKEQGFVMLLFWNAFVQVPNPTYLNHEYHWGTSTCTEAGDVGNARKPKRRRTPKPKPKPKPNATRIFRPNSDPSDPVRRDAGTATRPAPGGAVEAAPAASA